MVLLANKKIYLEVVGKSSGSKEVYFTTEKGTFNDRF
jgi:hypothetical protein